MAQHKFFASPSTMADEEVAAAQKEVTSVNTANNTSRTALNDEAVWWVRRTSGRTALDDEMALERAFSLFDADGDGKLTEDEVVAVLTRKTGQGTELSEEAARATWKRWQYKYDLNNDGKISFEELVEAI